MQDGNFSVIANLQNGVLVSVTVTEPKESITLKNNGNVSILSKYLGLKDIAIYNIYKEKKKNKDLQNKFIYRS